MGALVLTYLVPKPFEFVAMDNVISAINDPPPVSPVPAMMFVLLCAAPRLVLASVGLLAPVPPSATVKSVIPEIVPLEIATLVEQLNIRARDEYGGSAGSPMVAQLLEAACGTELRAPGFPENLEEYLATMPRAERLANPIL